MILRRMTAINDSTPRLDTVGAVGYERANIRLGQPKGELGMSKAKRRTYHGDARGMSRRKLLQLGLLSTAATPLLRAARATAQTGGAQPQASKATGELKNPVEFKAPKVKASGPTTISFWQYVGFHVDAQKFIAEEYKDGFQNPAPDATAARVLACVAVALDHKLGQRKRRISGQLTGRTVTRATSRHVWLDTTEYKVDVT